MRPASAPEREHASAASGPRRTATAWLLGIAVTAFLVWDHDGARGYHAPSLHLVLDTVDACVALLAASLAYGRLLRGGSSQDLLLAQGLALLALAGLGLPYAAGVLAGSDGPLVVWLPLTIRLLGSLLILVASLSPLRPVARRTGRRSALAVPVGLVVVVSCLLWAGRARLPEPVRASVTTAYPDLAATSGHPLLTAAQSLSGLCFGVASVAFAVQSARRDDPLLRWLGPAFALATLARVHYVVFPSLYTDWLYTGDLLRTGCYVLLLIGATRELRQYWESRPHTAVLGDRRRLARELHDGVIQELAYIRAESHAIPAGMTRDLIVTACDRALDEARTAVHALGRHSDDSLSTSLRRVAAELSSRYRVVVDVQLDESVDAGPHQQQALSRITREAVSNAVRHGGAARICIRTDSGGMPRRLVVQDDGKGFHADALPATRAGYGLISMRERATALPGRFEITSEPGHGTAVAVQW